MCQCERTYAYIHRKRTNVFVVLTGWDRYSNCGRAEELRLCVMRVVLDGECGIRTWSKVLICGWMVNTMWSRWKIRMWFILEIRKWQLRGSKIFLDEKLNTWPGSVASGSQLFQFLFFVP